MAAPSFHPRIGYAPFSSSLTHPGDRRRFIAYARARNLQFELAQPDERYDIVVLTEFADISVWHEYKKGKIVYDCIDSYLSIPRTDLKQMLRGMAWYASGRHRRLCADFRAAIERMCRRADAVICTTDEQKGLIQPLCGNTHIILDIHDSTVKSVKCNYHASTPFNLVWEGLPSSLSYLKVIGPVLSELSRRKPLTLNIITDVDRPRLFGKLGRIDSLEFARRIFDKVTLYQWDEITCADLITRCDVAIIPIPLDNPFASGKPGNKLALLWRLAMPVVTSATLSYQAMQNSAGLGHFACRSNSDWHAALNRLMTAEEERCEAGQRGYSFVAKNLGTDKLLQLWDNVFKTLGFDFSGEAISLGPPEPSDHLPTMKIERLNL
jgi:hypothetical protein